MPKTKKIKKIIRQDDKDVKNAAKKIEGEEEPEKEGGTLSDGVLDAFEELAPVDILLEEEVVVTQDDDDEIDSGDYKANDEW